MTGVSPIMRPTLQRLDHHSKTSEPYVLVFMSDWCPACQEYKPVVEFCAERYEGRLPVYVVRPEDAGDLSDVIQLDSIGTIPYTYFVLGRTVLAEVPGAMRFHDFRTAVETLSRAAVK